MRWQVQQSSSQLFSDRRKYNSIFCQYWLEWRVDKEADIKFLLLHDQKADDAIRQFFTDVYDLYTKTLMNPFYEVDMRITSGVFDGKVKQAAKKYLWEVFSNTW